MTDIFGKILISFADNPENAWTIDDAVKGTSIMGATGSGKTSASGKRLAKAFLEEGWGGLVLCAKTDEVKLWEKYCRKAGRLDDLIIFGKNSKLPGTDEYIVFNPLDYEMKRDGEGAGETTNLTNIFMNIYRMGNRIAQEGDTKEERYWDTALKRCLNRVIELLKLGDQDLSYSNMINILSTAKRAAKYDMEDFANKLDQEIQGLSEIPDTRESGNFCLKCLGEAYKKAVLSEDGELFELLDFIEKYFTKTMPEMGGRTRSIVTESFMGLAEPFLSGILKKHFSGKTNIFPEWTFEENNHKYQNKIIVLNFPVKEFLDAGIIAQSITKLMFQQAVERRRIKKDTKPVFLWCDEAQYFINPYDQIFLTTARGSRAATVFLSQNISNYLAVMGSGSDATARVDSLMGNLCTKIFHANSDSTTNNYASQLIGSTLQHLETEGRQSAQFSITDTFSQGINSQFLPQVQPKEFTILKTGGEKNDYTVQGVISVNGKKWVNNKNYLKISFKQNFSDDEPDKLNNTAVR